MYITYGRYIIKIIKTKMIQQLKLELLKREV